MTDSEKNTQSQRVSKAPPAEPERSDAAEEKRLAARRRFLLGGAAAVPVVITTIRAEAGHQFVGFSTCLSMVLPGGTPPEDPGTSIAIEACE